MCNFKLDRFKEVICIVKVLRSGSISLNFFFFEYFFMNNVVVIFCFNVKWCMYFNV